MHMSYSIPVSTLSFWARAVTVYFTFIFSAIKKYLKERLNVNKISNTLK